MTRPSMIRLEKNAGGVVVACSGCGHWRALAPGMGAAHQSASVHEKLVHPGDYRARNAAKMWARRHPDDPDTPTRPLNV